MVLVWKPSTAAEFVQHEHFWVRRGGGRSDYTSAVSQRGPQQSMT